MIFRSTALLLSSLLASHFVCATEAQYPKTPLSAEEWDELKRDAMREEKGKTPTLNIPALTIIRQLNYILREDDPRWGREEIVLCMRYLYRYKRYQALAGINGLHLWQHSEHFLEARPAALLDILLELRWHVNSAKLRMAIAKLETLLPSDGSDMIDSAAGNPLGKLLMLLAIHEGEEAQNDIAKYLKSSDPYLSHAALCAQLYIKKLPQPTRKDLLQEQWKISTVDDLERLSPEQRLLAESIEADEGARKASFAPWVNAAMIQRVIAHWKSEELGFHQHAEGLKAYLNESGDGLRTHLHDLQRARLFYQFIEKKGPRAYNARKILNNPHLLDLP